VLFSRFGYRLLGRTTHLVLVPTSIAQVRVAHRATSLLALLLTGVAGAAVGGMLAFHTYLIATAQGTIDLYRNRAAARAARKRGVPWRNVYDLGVVRNWQERFEVTGRLWWLMWVLPRSAPPLANGIQIPVVKGADLYADAGDYV
jgi:predicted small integral membrane protein